VRTISSRGAGKLAIAVKDIEGNVTGIQRDVSNLGDFDRLFAQIKRGQLYIVFAKPR
jgi:hypothetical protein